ncbi:hypothetical protein LSAT2_004591 [Lamellibrachia satsuma]|nr:hypothetical protein LSAT2_004591 [Lamellibrachia satsuma]
MQTPNTRIVTSNLLGGDCDREPRGNNDVQSVRITLLSGYLPAIGDISAAIDSAGVTQTNPLMTSFVVNQSVSSLYRICVETAQPFSGVRRLSSLVCYI